MDVGKNLGMVNGKKSGYCTTGNPINPGTGNKYQVETDYQSWILEFRRYYNSTPIDRPGMTGNWLHSNSAALSVSLATTIVAYRPDGKAHTFMLNTATNQLQPDADTNLGVVQLKDAANHPAGWTLTLTEEGQTETYDVNGKLLAIATLDGLSQTLSYSTSTTPANIAPKAGLLISVTDTFGRRLNFTYDANARMNAMIDPSGAVTAYQYDTNNNLSTVTYPDSTPSIATDNPTRSYKYGELANTANVSQPHALTGIIDENGNRYATWKYDGTGLAISSEHAGGVGKYSLAYSADGRSVGITDPLGAVRTTQLSSLLGVIKSTGSSQPAGTGCPASASALGYDANGNTTGRTDFNGNLSCYVYNNRNLETIRLEGIAPTIPPAPTASCPANLATYTPPANSSQRLINTQWHPNWRLPTRIAEPTRLTTNVYNGQADPTAGNNTPLTCAPATALQNGLPIPVLCKRILQSTDDATGSAGFAATLTAGVPARAPMFRI